MVEQTEVEWPTCVQAGCVGVRSASARMCLAHSGEEDTAAALKLISETGAIDARGVHITRALLERILAAAPRGENGEPLIEGCRFDRATFSGSAGFENAKFSGVAEFARATFSNDARFDGASFAGSPVLSGIGVIVMRRANRGIGRRGRSWPCSSGLSRCGTLVPGTAAAIRLVTCGGTAWFGPVWHGAAAS